MRKLILILFLLLTPILDAADKSNLKKIAIIDTGLDVTDPRFRLHICGYKDLTGTGIQDDLGHGTHVTGLIKQYAKDANYCFYIIKFYNEQDSGSVNEHRLVRAFEEAVKQNIQFVNFSGGGQVYSKPEYLAIKNNPKVKFIVAAGNNNKNLDVNDYFPASYRLPNIITVGALTHEGKKAVFSNYGSFVVTWEVGQNVKSTLPYPQHEGYMSGTSMSTAIHTGKLVYEAR